MWGVWPDMIWNRMGREGTWCDGMRDAGTGVMGCDGIEKRAEGRGRQLFYWRACEAVGLFCWCGVRRWGGVMRRDGLDQIEVG